MYDQPYDHENSFGRTYGEHREALELSDKDWFELMHQARELGIALFGTTFDAPSADFLAELGVPAFKIASADLVNTPLLRQVASYGKPIFLSTGGGTLEDVERAVDAILPINPQLCVMQCTAAYPAEAEDLNLRVITTLRERYPELVIGLSDHQDGYTMSLLGYMLGARVIEKHFTLSHGWKGTDHAFSLMPDGMRRLVRDLRRAPLALGDGVKRPLPCEESADPEDGQEARGRARPAVRARARAGRRRFQVAGRRRAAAVRARARARPAAAALARVRGERHLRGPRARRGASRGAGRRRRALNLEPFLARIRLAVFDFDGVFTDNHVWVNERGRRACAAAGRDGFGLARLREVGVDAVILSTEAVPIAMARARKLDGRLAGTGSATSSTALRRRRERRGVALADTAYVGNDINDAACLEAVGLPVVPADAWPEVAGLARWTLERRGGEGCVREFCDAVWAAQAMTDPLFDLSGRVAVVTGGLGQLGSVYVDGPARAGHEGARSSTWPRSDSVDVTDRASIEAATERVIAELGRAAPARQQRRARLAAGRAAPRRSARSRPTPRRRSTGSWT